MDNITHTLIGATLARSLPKRYQKPSVYWASVIGSNLPDLDFIYRFIPGNTSLDYLIEHRGYTHTFLALIPLGFFTAWAAKKIGKDKRISPSLLGVAFAALLLHITADFMNNYGVHPFSPFWDHWFYGDAIFIVEPLLWFAMIPFVAQRSTHAWAKGVWWVLYVTMLGLIWFHPESTLFSSLLGSLFALITLTLTLQTKHPLVPITSLLLVYASFLLGSFYSKAQLEKTWSHWKGHEETLLDIQVNPLPTHPFCWRGWVLSKNSSSIIARWTGVNLLPSFFSASPQPCFSELHISQGTAFTSPIIPLPPHSSSSISWIKEHRIRAESFREKVEKSCTTRRLLSFVRIPFLNEIDDHTFIFGDLRYDQNEGLGFTERLITLPDLACKKKEKWESPFFQRIADQ